MNQVKFSYFLIVSAFFSGKTTDEINFYSQGSSTREILQSNLAMVLRPCQTSEVVKLNEVKELDEDKIFETFEKLDWPRTIFLEDLQKRTTTIYWEPTILESTFEIMRSDFSFLTMKFRFGKILSKFLLR